MSGLLTGVPGLAAGTDPHHPEHWPPITDRAQPMVEAASIAIALHESRPWLWDHLDDDVRQRVCAWLGGFVGADVNDSNWRLFQVITEEFLASVGSPHSRAEIDAGLARLDDWYRGGGWYTDGDGRNFDYYNAWALHLYPVLWARIAGARADTTVVARHRARLREFLAVHQHFFGSDGAPVHQGRSLTYRFATTAPLWAGALADATPLPPGRTRRLASGALKHFAERGRARRAGPAQPRLVPALPPRHPALLGPLLPVLGEQGLPGTAPARRPPRLDGAGGARPRGHRRTSPGSARPGLAAALHHGRRHRTAGQPRQRPPPAPARDGRRQRPQLPRFAYSSATAPETPGPDNHIALRAPDGTPSQRGRVHPLGAESGRAGSWQDGRIDTVSLVRGAWEVRVHRLDVPADTTVREGGWAVADDMAAPDARTGPARAVARRADGLTSALVGLHGWADAEASVMRAVGVNAVGHHSATPVLQLPQAPPLLVTLVVLSADPHTSLTGASATVAADGTVEGPLPGRQPGAGAGRAQRRARAIAWSSARRNRVTVPRSRTASRSHSSPSPGRCPRAAPRSRASRSRCAYGRRPRQSVPGRRGPRRARPPDLVELAEPRQQMGPVGGDRGGPRGPPPPAPRGVTQATAAASAGVETGHSGCAALQRRRSSPARPARSRSAARPAPRSSSGSAAPPAPARPSGRPAPPARPAPRP